MFAGMNRAETVICILGQGEVDFGKVQRLSVGLEVSGEELSEGVIWG